MILGEISDYFLEDQEMKDAATDCVYVRENVVRTCLRVHTMWQFEQLKVSLSLICKAKYIDGATQHGRSHHFSATG